MTGPRRALSVVTRLFACGCAIAATVLAIYCVMLVYAAATFEHDSLPGPVVLFLAAVGVGLAAVVCGGLSQVLWRRSGQASDADFPAGFDRRRG